MNIRDEALYLHVEDVALTAFTEDSGTEMLPNGQIQNVWANCGGNTSLDSVL